MGARGPKRTPTKVLKARGSRPRQDRTAEPVYPAKAPRPPKALPKAARERWDEIVAALVEAGTVTELDRDALAAYCVHWARWYRLAKAEARVKPVIATRAGPRKHPLLAALAEAHTQMMRSAAALGLTPADRSRVKADKRDDPDELDPAAKYFAEPTDGGKARRFPRIAE